MHKLKPFRERVAPGRLNSACLLPVVVFFLFTSLALPAQAPTPQVTLSVTPASANQTCTMTATVMNGSIPATAGSVMFTNHEVVLGTAPVNAQGVATLNVALPASFYYFVAHYSGSADMGPANSNPDSTVITGGPDSLGLTSSGSGPYTLTATLMTNEVSPNPVPITFTDNTTGQTLGTANFTFTSYQTPVTIPSGPSGYFHPVGDFNGDGRMDTVTTNDTSDGTPFQIQVNLTNADGSTTVVDSTPFPDSTDGYQIDAWGNFNGDGVTDLVVQDLHTNVISVLLGSTSGQFTAAGSVPGPPILEAVVGDFNNDGHLDLIAGGSRPDSPNPFQFFAGDGAGNLAAGLVTNAPQYGLSNVADYTAAYDQGGNLDLFSYLAYGTPPSYGGQTLYLGTGDGITYTPEPTTIWGSYPPPGTTTSLITGDFNHDGIPDIAYATSGASPDTITVLYGDGKGNFSPPPPNGQNPPHQFVFDIGSHYNVVVEVADINGDGENDIVAFVQDESPSQAPGGHAPWGMIVLTGNGSYNFLQWPEAQSDMSGVNFPNPPTPFSYPIAGEPLYSQSPGNLPSGLTIPFLSTCCTEMTLTATLNNVTVPPGNNTITASWPGDGVSPSATSNTIEVSGGSGGTGGGSGSGSGPTIATLAAPNGSATMNNGVLQLTDGGTWETGSAWSPQQVDVQSFTTTFTFQLTNAQADGFTFAIQNAGKNVLGANGGNLGYGGIPNSAALKFDLFDNAGEGSDSIGVYTNGVDPSVPATDMTGNGVDLHSGDVMQAQLTYDGASLHVTITDTSTNATFRQTYSINIPQAVGSPTAYVGFTGATGALASTQQILSWSYAPLPYYPNFSNGPALLLSGGAVETGGALIIPNGGSFAAYSAWFPNPVPISQFTTDFTFTGSDVQADGFTFTIQNAGATAVGPAGGGLGYGPDTPGEPVGIPNSVAIKFDFYDNQGEGNDSTGIYTNGDSPTVPAIDLSSTGIDLHSTHPVNVHMVYDGSTITMTLLDLISHATWSHYFYGVNVPQLVGGSTAYVGFTAGTGGLTAYENINGWTYLPSNTITSPVKTY